MKQEERGGGDPADPLFMGCAEEVSVVMRS